MEVDHIFICVSPGAKEANLLTDYGFKEGSANVHPGQGTANRRFFFDNVMIELLFLTNAEEARSKLTRPTMLYERLTSEDDKVSPFGICFRPAEGDDKRQATFPCWAYRPTYLPPDLHIDVGNTPIDEPMWFFLPFASRPDQSARCRNEPRSHANGISELSSIEITSPKAGDLSTTAEIVSVRQNIKFLSGENHLLSLGFNDFQSGLVKDFRPDLPLVIKW